MCRKPVTRSHTMSFDDCRRVQKNTPWSTKVGRVVKQALAVTTYDLRPDLLEVGTNLDDGMFWEIQPAYRQILRTF